MSKSNKQPVVVFVTRTRSRAQDGTQLIGAIVATNGEGGSGVRTPDMVNDLYCNFGKFGLWAYEWPDKDEVASGNLEYRDSVAFDERDLERALKSVKKVKRGIERLRDQLGYVAGFADSVIRFALAVGAESIVIDCQLANAVTPRPQSMHNEDMRFYAPGQARHVLERIGNKALRESTIAA